LNMLESLATTCGTSSWFVHVTVVPEVILRSGPKLKLSIVTSVAGICLLSALTANRGEPIDIMMAAERIVVLSATTHFIRFIAYFSFNLVF
jgi:hypothetical protein